METHKFVTTQIPAGIPGPISGLFPSNPQRSLLPPGWAAGDPGDGGGQAAQGGRGGGKLSGLIALEALTVSLFTRDPSRSAPRAEPSPAPLCSSGGEGCAGSRCSAPSLCSIPPLVWGEALGSVRGRWVGAVESRGFQLKSQPLSLDVGNVPLHNPPLSQPGSGQPCRQVSATLPSVPLSLRRQQRFPNTPRCFPN